MAGRRSMFWQSLDPLTAAFGFGTTVAVFRALLPGIFAGVTAADLWFGIGAAIAAFWFSAQYQRLEETDWLSMLQLASLTMGLLMAEQATLMYLSLIAPIPLVVLFAGAALSTMLLAAQRRWLFPRLWPQRQGVLLLGFDPVARAMLGAIPWPMLGVLAPDSRCLPPEIPYLGSASRFETVVAEQSPTHIVVSRGDGFYPVAPARLLELRLSGVVVEDAASVYEWLLNRVCCQRLSPSSFLFSPELRARRRAMALQAVYTNLLGLLFAAVLSPLLIFGGLIVILFSGGPALETVGVIGFQGIPFQLVRFRTRARDGSLTLAGRILSQLGFVNLPHILNVIRGEMAFLGPRPVRAEFAERLRELIPLYPHRFKVKPGLFGWAQIHCAETAGGAADELQCLEYDLFYIKEISLALDLEIVARTLWRKLS